MPLYVRAGAIVPLGPVKHFTGEQVKEPLTLVVYPGADGQFQLYEDDGSSFGYRKGEWMGLDCRWSDRDRRLSLRLARGSRMLPPMHREIRVRLAGSKSDRPIAFDGRSVEIKL
jgi:hypothetical protein